MSDHCTQHDHDKSMTSGQCPACAALAYAYANPLNPDVRYVATSDEGRIRADERAKVVKEIAARLDRGPHGFQSRHAFAGYIRAEFGGRDESG